MTASSDVSSAVHFLDVGQAHATIAVDADSAVVIDCPHSGVQPASNLLEKLNPERLDIVVTHQDLDHCGGIHNLLRHFGSNSTTLYMNPVARPHPKNQPRVNTVLRSILSALDEVGANPDHAFAGRTGTTGAITWSVLAPPYRRDLRAALLGGSLNRSSIVLMLQLRGYRFLIPGDIDDTAVTALLSSGTQLSAEVFLLPHHGARLTTISQLLSAVDPQYVVVSAARRRTHPHITTLQAAASYNCRIMCTQVTHHCHPGTVDPKRCAGSIVFDISGGSLAVDPSVAAHKSRIDELESPVCLPRLPGSSV